MLRRCQASLPIVVVLPVPLTPTTRITVGSGRRSILSSPVRASWASSSASRLRERLAADERALLGLALELLDDLGGGLRADVGVDQRLLEALPGRPRRGRPRTASPGPRRQRLARLAHVLAQAAEEAAALLLALGLVGRPRRGAVVEEEEVVPVAGHAVRQDISEAMSALPEARESLSYWETRLETLPRRAVRKRREAREMAERWRERVCEAERVQYGAGILGALLPAGRRAATADRGRATPRAGSRGVASRAALAAFVALAAVLVVAGVVVIELLAATSARCRRRSPGRPGSAAGRQKRRAVREGHPPQLAYW